VVGRGECAPLVLAVKLNIPKHLDLLAIEPVHAHERVSHTIPRPHRTTATLVTTRSEWKVEGGGPKVPQQQLAPAHTLVHSGN
jgi:hypothetical protein